jgi:hypothetical protein
MFSLPVTFWNALISSLVTLCSARADPVHRGDQQVDQAVGHLPLTFPQQRRQQGHRRLRGLPQPAAQVRRRLHRGPRPPPGHHLRRDVGEQPRRQADRPDRLQLADLGQHRVQAHVPRHRLDQRQHRVLVFLVIAGDVLVILIFVPGTFNDAVDVAVLGADQGDNPPGGAGGGDPRGDDGEPLLLRLVQRRPDGPGHPVGSRRLDPLRPAPAEQFRADLVPVPLRVRDMGGQPVRELLLVSDRALAEPEVTADLRTVVLQRAAVGPFVEPQVRRRNLHLPGNELNHLVRQLRPALGKPPVLREELQQQRETQPRRPPLPRDQILIVRQHRPALDKLVKPKRHTIHAHMVT